MLPQMDGDMLNMGIGMVGKTSAMAPRATFDFQRSVTSMDGFAGDHRAETWGMMNQPSASGFHSEFEGRESGGGGGFFDGMALPDHFLEQYYTQVRTGVNIFDCHPSMLGLEHLQLPTTLWACMYSIYHTFLGFLLTNNEIDNYYFILI